jgi:hypothetical protein
MGTTLTAIDGGAPGTSNRPDALLTEYPPCHSWREKLYLRSSCSCLTFGFRPEIQRIKAVSRTAIAGRRPQAGASHASARETSADARTPVRERATTGRAYARESCASPRVAGVCRALRDNSGRAIPCVPAALGRPRGAPSSSSSEAGRSARIRSSDGHLARACAFSARQLHTDAAAQAGSACLYFA